MKGNRYIVVLIFVIFFAISFLTNILGSINPNASDSFALNGAMTGLLPFSFFIAYALMSIPAGMIVQRYEEKKSLVSAWLIAFAGASLFSLIPSFPVFLLSLFMIGCGMALLQVILYPLLRVAGGEEHFAFNSVFAQLVFGAASFLSPFLYTYLAPQGEQHGSAKLLGSLVPHDLWWVAIYWIFAAISLGMIVIVVLSRVPKVIRKEDEVVGAWSTHRELFGQRTVIIYFFGIFFYVGLEQGIGNWISEFLRTYRGYGPTVGAVTVSWFWGMMTIGCLPGMWLLKVMDSRRVLRIFTLGAVVILAITLLSTDSDWSAMGFMALGFCLSVMYGIIFSLALNSVPRQHGSFAGILCTGIAGGAIVPLIIGQLKDFIGLQAGMTILFLPLLYLIWISYWAKPLVANATFKGDA